MVRDTQRQAESLELDGVSYMEKQGEFQSIDTRLSREG